MTNICEQPDQANHLIISLSQYLAKQAAALRDMNESRMKVYEQLEVSMVDIERQNRRLCEDTVLDKEKIRRLVQREYKIFIILSHVQPVCHGTDTGAAVRGSPEMSGRGCAEERKPGQ